jgi:hypothetical protein
MTHSFGHEASLPSNISPSMIRFPKALSAWLAADFNAVLKEEIECLDADLLPLQQGLSRASYVRAGPLNALLISVTEDSAGLCVKAGIFYSGIMAGCSCADDPAATDEINEYCELRFDINRSTAEATVMLLSDE